MPQPNSRARVVQEDKLGNEPSRPGQVILQQGDAAFRAATRTEGGTSLPPAEGLFLRFVAYLVFAESVCIPARHLLTNEDAFAACKLAEPLVVEGLVRPERREGASSFVELVGLLGLGQDAMSRAEWLDAKAGRHTRTFRSDELGAEYRRILIDDLAPGPVDDPSRGALRVAIGPRRSVTVAASLDEALAELKERNVTTPDGFARVLSTHLPEGRSGRTIQKLTYEWAMARYFLTPTLLDSVNTREIPLRAARLLRKGNAFDPNLTPGETPAPAEALHDRLLLGVQVHDVRHRASQYCEAVLNVRQRVPHARRAFADIAQRAELGPVSAELTELMRAELKRQEGATRSSGDVFTIVTSLLGGVGTFGVVSAADVANSVGEFGLSLGAGAAAAAAANRALIGRQDAKNRVSRPWPVAIENMQQATNWIQS